MVDDRYRPDEKKELTEFDWRIIGSKFHRLDIPITDDAFVATEVATALERLAYRLKGLTRLPHTLSRRTVHMEIAAETESAKVAISSALRQAGALFIFVTLIGVLPSKAFSEGARIGNAGLVKITERTVVQCGHCVIRKAPIPDEKLVAGCERVIPSDFGFYVELIMRACRGINDICAARSRKSFTGFPFVVHVLQFFDEFGWIGDPCFVGLSDIESRLFANIFVFDYHLNRLSNLRFLYRHVSRDDPSTLGLFQRIAVVSKSPKGNNHEDPSADSKPLFGFSLSKPAIHVVGIALIFAASILALGGASFLLGLLGDAGILPSILLWLGCGWLVYHAIGLLRL